MTYRHILICFLVALTTLKCSKEDNAVNYGKSYLKKDIKPDGKIRVYDRTGELNGPFVTDQYDDFLDVYSRDLLDNYLSSSYLDTLYFTNDSEASLSHFGTRRSYIVKSERSSRIFTGKEITDNVSINVVCSEDFNHRITKYANEILQNELTSSVGGVYRFDCKVRQKYIFNVTNNGLTFPIYVYVLKDRPSGSLTTGWIYNELKDDFYKELDENSELAYQKLTVTYN